MKRLALTLAVMLASAGASLAQPAAGDFPKPDRPVAQIVSPMWASEAERDRADEAGQVISLLRLRPGMTIADIGAGSGYHTIRLSAFVGPTGRILAEDVVDEYLNGLRAEVARRRLANVTVVKGTPDDPKLPAGSVDVALLVHMYHEIEQPYALLYNLAAAMKPGGRVAIEDLDRPTQAHGTPPALLKCELEAVGYRQVSFDVLRGGLGYLAVFEAPAPEKRPQPSAIKACRQG